MTPAEATVIVVEDEAGVRATLCGILEEAGYKVIGLNRGADALKMIREKPFDAVITDIRLPDVGGMEILELAQEINPDAGVIMVTGYASVETAIDAVNQGAYAYLVKPVNPDLIKTTLANACKQQRLSLENKKLVESLQLFNKLLFDANEKLTRATQAKTEFLANMSHELRTPLNVIIGFSELMTDEVPGEINKEQRQCLQDILTSGKHLLDLINDVLDLSKIESGKMKFRLNNVDLAGIIPSIASAMMPILASKKQSLDVKMAQELPPVYADEGKVRQVLLNLLSNATKFTPDEGKISIEVISQADWCQVTVTDTGTGIKKEDQERIFEPFCQVESPLTGEKGGAGLGLALAKQIVERHGG